MDIKIDFKDLEKDFKAVTAKAPKAITQAVTDCALDLAGRSAPLAPIESGDLRNNCHAEVNGQTVFTEQTATNTTPTNTLSVSATVGYSLPYARRQHEDLTLRHDRTDGYRRKDGTTVNMVAGGQAKYLEQPFLERRDKYIEHIKKAVDSE